MKKSKKIIIEAIAFPILVIILFLFLVFPLISLIEKKTREIIAIKKEFSLFEFQSKNINNIKQDYLEILPDIRKIDSMFLDPNVPVSLIRFWEDSAKSLGSKIEIVPADIKGVSDFWPYIAFQLTFNGSFDNLLKFVKKADNVQYLTEIQSLIVEQPKDKKSPPGYITAVLVIKAFTKQ